MCTNEKCTFPLGYKEMEGLLVTLAKDISSFTHDPNLDEPEEEQHVRVCVRCDTVPMSMRLCIYQLFHHSATQYD